MRTEVAIRRGVGTVVLDVRHGDGSQSCFNYTEWDQEFESVFLQRGVCKLSVPRALPHRLPGILNKARPVEINGVTYPSNKAAARALGISPSTLVRRIRAGLVRYADGKPVRPIAKGSWRPPA
jgi:hypothetical protein